MSEGKWNAAQWLQSLSLHKVLAESLELPEEGTKQYNYIRKLERAQLEGMLGKAEVISSICGMVMEHINLLQSKAAQVNGSVVNDKFQTNAKFQMSYGSLSLFYGGLESLLGPPKMVNGSLFVSMEQEHCLLI